MTRSVRRDAFAVLPSLLCLILGSCAWAQELPWSQRVATSAMHRWPQGQESRPSKHDPGTLLNGMDAVWYGTADGTYYKYIKQSIDTLIASDGSIPTYDPALNSPDDIALGRQLLLLYRVTQDEKYYRAAVRLHKQISTQPRIPSGEHQIDPKSSYMAEPFDAEYASIFQQQQDFAEITKKFALADRTRRSPKTRSLWARDTASYMVALVDSLPYYPQNDSNRPALLEKLQRIAASLIRYQDKKTGLWHEELDKPGQQGSYVASSTACMFVYALQKGVRLGYLPQQDSAKATQAWQGILSHFVRSDASGIVTILGSDEAKVTDGNASVNDNDPAATGAFLLAGTEMEIAPTAGLAHGEAVLLDAWFNSQKRENAAGQQEYFHYKWDDYSNTGYSLLGHIFASYGASLNTLYEAPTLARLKGAQYYIIASPDIPSKNPSPHYMQPEDAAQVAEWVKQGGVLILMENDPANADINHLDQLADRVGVHFNNVLSHNVLGDQVSSGQIATRGDGAIFHHPHTLYMKDTCTISPSSTAVSLINDRGDTLIATNRYGKGMVVAVADPWLYNEYTDGRKVQPQQDNYAAGKEFVRWLLQTHHDILPPLTHALTTH